MDRNTKTISLSRPFPQIVSAQGMLYGGSQKLLTHDSVKEAGCGIVACANVLLHMSRNKPDCACDLISRLPDPVPLREFNDLCETLRRRWLPIAPHFGTMGPALAIGLSRCFREFGLPYKATWCTDGLLSHRIAVMLENEIPVVLAIGPNLSLSRKKHRLTLYTKSPGGALTAAARTNAHYVTVTAMEQDLLHVSSWGREYCIRLSEYRDYVNQYSSRLVSNVLLIQKL